MNKEIILHHHLGLGDHFICNGLVHEFTEKYDKIHLPVKVHNFETVSCLYKDWNNINTFEVKEEYKDVQKYASENNLQILRVGHEHLKNRGKVPWNIYFYNQVGVKYSARYKSFRLPKKLPGADKLYKSTLKMLQENKDYCLIHQQSSIGKFFINLDTKLPVIEIRPGITKNLLDYVKIIQNAKEIHCIDSSVVNLIDGMKTKTDKLFFHTAKPADIILSDKWKIIKY